MQFTVVTTREEFERLKPEWDALSDRASDGDFYLTSDWLFACLFMSNSPPPAPRVFAVRYNEELIAVIPCSLRPTRIRLFTYKTLELISSIYTPYCSATVLQGTEQQVADAFAEYLLSDFAREWDLLSFENLSITEPFVAHLMKTFNRKKATSRLVEQYDNIISDFAGAEDSESYFRSLSRNRRNMIQKSINRMNREGSFDIVLTTSPDQPLDLAMDHYYEIYGQSWKVPETDPHFHRRLAHLMAEAGKLRLFVLYFKEGRDESTPTPFPTYKTMADFDRTIPEGYLPIATYFFVVHGDRSYFLKSAYREDYSRYGAGTALFWYATSYVIDIDNVRYLDHQKGGETYKLSWGDFNEKRYLYQVANPQNLRAAFELWNENHCIPRLRRIKRKIIKTKDAGASQ